MHGLIERDTLALSASLERVTLAAGVEGLVMAGAAARRTLFMVDVGEGYGPQFAGLEIRFRGAQKQEVGLAAFEARWLVYYIDGSLPFLVMTTCAHLRPRRIGLLELPRWFSVTTDTRLVGRNPEGHLVLFFTFAVTVTAGSFLALYVDEILGGLIVVEMVAGFALLVSCLDMTIVKGLVKTKRLSRG